MFMDYEELFDKVITGLLRFTRKANITSEIVAEQYRRKFTHMLLENNRLLNLKNVKYKGVYTSLFDVMYINNRSDKLSTSKYPKLALNFIVGELSKHIGISFKDFLKLTLEETDILLDIVSLKQTVTDTVNGELKNELDKDNKFEIDPFMFEGNSL